MANSGKIVQIIGPVIDVQFPEGSPMPAIYNALRIVKGDRDITLEVVRHLEPGKVRAIALASTDGLERGAEVEDLERELSVPVGPEVLGHIFDVAGKPLDGYQGKFTKFGPLHRSAPP